MWVQSSIKKCCCFGRESGQERVVAETVHEQFLKGDEVLDDVTRFQKAYAIEDLNTMVELLQSDENIVPLEKPMHPWATSPLTVAALSATQLAIIASKGGEKLEVLRTAGAIKRLLNLVRTGELDKLHAAVVALSFLAVDCAENCIEMAENGALGLLVPLIGDGEPDGLRAAAAQTCRNIFVLDIKKRQDFVLSGGVEQLVTLLKRQSPAGQPPYTQTEAMYHIEDLILASGEEIGDMMDVVKRSEIIGQLEILKDSTDEDLASAVQYLRSRLLD